MQRQTDVVLDMFWEKLDCTSEIYLVLEIKLVKSFKFITTCSRQVARKYTFISNRYSIWYAVPDSQSFFLVAILNLILW